MLLMPQEYPPADQCKPIGGWSADLAAIELERPLSRDMIKRDGGIGLQPLRQVAAVSQRISCPELQ
jgi:hypothetical protein